MKIAKLVPIYKTGDINIYENYRLISKIPVISKIIERAIYNRLLSYIYRFNLLNSNQTIDA